MQIVLASSNKGKISELQSLFSDFSIEVIPQTSLGITDTAETGLTFVENALIKARHAAKLSGLPALADDSGLEIEILNGRPGVYSARYSGTRRDEDNIAKVLAELNGVAFSERRATYRCVLVFLTSYDDASPLIFQGSWSGFITEEPQGTGGFGYDPIFWDPTYQKTAAELTMEEKNQVSHRGEAHRELSKYFEKICSYLTP